MSMVCTGSKFIINITKILNGRDKKKNSSVNYVQLSLINVKVLEKSVHFGPDYQYWPIFINILCVIHKIFKRKRNSCKDYWSYSPRLNNGVINYKITKSVLLSFIDSFANT